MSQITPSGAAGQPQQYRAEVNEGKLFINGMEHLVRNNEGKPVPQLHLLIAREINNPNSSYKPGRGVQIGEYELTITPVPPPRLEKTKENKSPPLPGKRNIKPPQGQAPQPPNKQNVQNKPKQ